MNIRPVSHKNTNLWRKSEELIEKAGLILSPPGNLENARVMQFKTTVVSIQNDIEMAYAQHEQELILYHFSKAKSSCLIAEEIIINLKNLLSLESFSVCLDHLSEMKSILDNYIHLCQINILIAKKERNNTFVRAMYAG